MRQDKQLLCVICKSGRFKIRYVCTGLNILSFITKQPQICRSKMYKHAQQITVDFTVVHTCTIVNVLSCKHNILNLKEGGTMIYV